MRFDDIKCACCGAALGNEEEVIEEEFDNCIRKFCCDRCVEKFNEKK